MAYDVDKAPAGFARGRARSYTRRMFAALVLALGLLAAVLDAGFGLRSSLLAFVAVVALYAVSRFFDKQEQLSRRWELGANAESAVGGVLNELRRDGYTVMHDIRHGEGNIDHLVSGPTGVFLIETKAHAYLARALPKARRQAAKLHDSLGVWVTPVICLADRPEQEPFRHDRVWIVPRQHLVAWLRAQRNQRLDFSRLAAFADTVQAD
jgi:Nuclease-related domain